MIRTLEIVARFCAMGGAGYCLTQALMHNLDNNWLGWATFWIVVRMAIIQTQEPG
jgi:hypothetical protein